MFDGILGNEASNEMPRRHRKQILHEMVQKYGLRELGNSESNRIRSICKGVSCQALCPSDAWVKECQEF